MSNFHMNLPAKKGRWGQWQGITTLAQWLPVVAVHDDSGWQPAPFIPWHQPFHNEAGHYSVKVKLPLDQKLAASGFVHKEMDLQDGWKEIEEIHDVWAMLTSEAVFRFATLAQPEVYIGNAGALFDGATLINDGTKAFLQKFVDAYAAWVERHAD